GHIASNTDASRWAGILAGFLDSLQ
ncbi:MAG: hypothetical protein JWQ76_953, partial [Ramlibacter sp.]|nr:hypothetical protein [Ramlibacter sp.]